MILDRLIPRNTQSTALATTARDPDSWLIAALGGNTTSAGIEVTPAGALSLSAYYAAIRAISEDIGKLPLVTYRRLRPRGKERLPDHPLYPILKEQPNSDMTAMTFRETLVQHALGWGNGYAEIIRNRLQEVEALELLLPNHVTPRRNASGQLEYQIRSDTGEIRTLPASRVFHFHGLGFDGVMGYSIAQMARETIGLGLAQERSGSRLFSNAVRSTGILETDGVLDPEAFRRLGESWRRVHGDPDRQWETIILEQGLKYKPISIQFKDAQWLEGRGFSVVEIARFFRITPHKIQHLDNATFSNVENLAIEYVGDTLMPHLVRFEQECKRKLISSTEPDVFVEHTVNALLRGDIQSRYAAYATARQWGWKSANDVLELENENPIGEQGDIYLVPMNMTPADQLGQEPEEPALPEPDTETSDENEGLSVLFAEEARDIAREARSVDDIIDGIAEAHIPHLADIFARVLRVEIDKLSRASRNGRQDDIASKLYAEHGEYVAKAITPALTALCRSIYAVLGDDWWSEGMDAAICGLAQRVSDNHVTVSRETLHDLGQWNSNGRTMEQATTAAHGAANLIRSALTNGTATQ
ncbi:MAG: phage portal protein [Planctomycetes bacterium]|nr:phage portal protein [Planctomycetota bacterium]